jgi:hypothetical protein
MDAVTIKTGRLYNELCYLSKRRPRCRVVYCLENGLNVRVKRAS